MPTLPEPLQAVLAARDLAGLGSVLSGMAPAACAWRLELARRVDSVWPEASSTVWKWLAEGRPLPAWLSWALADAARADDAHTCAWLAVHAEMPPSARRDAAAVAASLGHPRCLRALLDAMEALDGAWHPLPLLHWARRNHHCACLRLLSERLDEAVLSESFTLFARDAAWPEADAVLSAAPVPLLEKGIAAHGASLPLASARLAALRFAASGQSGASGSARARARG